MVKSKKNKKDVIVDEERDNSDVDTGAGQTKINATITGGDDDNEGTVKSSKKGGKNEKRKTSADKGSADAPIVTGSKKGQVEKKKSSRSNGQDSDDGSDDEKLRIVPKPGAKKSAFQLLQMDSDDDMGKSNGDSDAEVSTKKKGGQKGKQPKPSKPADDYEEDDQEPTPQQQQGKKGKKNKKKRNDEDEEDIEKLLAELEIEYSGGKVAGADDDSAEDDNKKKRPVKGATGRQHKKSISKEIDEMLDDDYAADMDNETGTGMKTAAQKKREKKERQRREAAEAKALGIERKVEEPKPVVVEPVVKGNDDNQEAQEENDSNADDKKSKKKKGKDKKVKEAEEEKSMDKAKKGPNKALVAAMQERLKAMKEEEERVRQEEEEKLRLIEEGERAHEEKLRLEQERKDKKKQKDKERKERLKAEGKLLSKKQQADRARAQAMLEALKAQGIVEVPETGKKIVRPGTRVKQPKPVKKDEEPVATEPVAADTIAPAATDKLEVKDKKPEVVIKDSWDASSSEDESEEKSTEKKKVDQVVEESDNDEEDDDDEDEDDEDDSDSGDSDDESDEEDQRTDAEKKRDRARQRIEKRREDAEKNLSLDVLRAPVVCVLGHVDTGKTKILDKLRRTNVQDGEAGGITQQIGATNVPIDAIKEQLRIVKNASEVEYKLPGLLIIDTPGHESFSNLRNRGSSLCDIAILVVDIMHGLEPQTIESINMLKSKKVPFVVALNKIDRLFEWKTMPRKDVRDTLKQQAKHTQLEFQQRSQEVLNQFAVQGLNAKLFYENPDTKTYISLVPTSAISGEGMGNLLHLICEFSQNMLAKRLQYSEELQATVLEVKAIPGLGTTIDAILINGRLREGETMVLAGTEGPITTQIRSLLMPQPMKELRVKNAYVEHKEVQAAQGVKIAAKDLEKSIAGLNLLVAKKPDEVEILREEVARELKTVLSSIKLSERGVTVQASTLGSLEALLEFLKTSKIPYSGIRIGPVVKRDVMKASTMLEHDKQYATILAFDVKVERDAQDLADSLHVKIFQADIIYHLFDKFIAYRDELLQKKRDEFKSIAVFPCKLKILPQFIFNTRDPIVMGVMVENGILKEGTPICVPSKDFVYLGIVTSIELNHKQMESARKGQEVCIKIENVPGETPKLYGRHFDEKDMLVSKISRQSIDACKDYFRDQLIKADWTLMVELKKLFEIL